MGAFAPTMPAGFLNVALSTYAQAYQNNESVYALLAPEVPVDRQSFQYLVFDRSAQRNDRQTLRAPGGRPQSVRMNYSTAPYFCKSHALEGDIPWEQQQYGLGLGFNEEQALVTFLMNRMTLDKEIQVATLATNPALVNTQTLSGTSMWDSYTNPTPGVSHPIQVIRAARSVIRQTGQDANIAIISDPVVEALINHPDILQRFIYTNGKGTPDMDFLSLVFGVRCVRASMVQLDDNNISSWVWGTSFVLAYSQQAASQYDLSAFKIFNWSAAPGTVNGYGVLQFPDPYLNKKTNISSVDQYYDIRATAPSTVFTFNGCVQTPVMGAIAPPVLG